MPPIATPPPASPGAPPRPSTPEPRDRPAPTSAPPPVVVQAAPPPRGFLGTLVQLLAVLVLVVMLLGLAGAGLLVASMFGVGGQVAGAGGQVQRAAQSVAGAGRQLLESTDPARPPTGLTYDTEFSSLRVVPVGASLGDAQQYAVTLTGIQRRAGADSPDTALYATVHAELKQPRQTRLLGQVIRSDSDPHDEILYKGEAFRLGSTVYRVNWVSDQDQAIAIAAYRHPDQVTQPLKFSFD